jgi:DNA-binding transcriptional LysR family regulator
MTPDSGPPLAKFMDAGYKTPRLTMGSRPLDLRHLRHFVALAETGNFHRAAERCFLTQSSLSRSIQSLESDLGIQLFRRQAKKVELSAAGRALYPQALSLLEQARRTEALMDDLKKGRNGVLRIAFLPSTTISILPELLRRFSAQTEDVSVALQEMTTDAQRQALLAGQIDVGLLRDLGTVPELQQCHLSTETWCLVLPEQHALLRNQRITPDILAQETLIVLRRELAPGAYDRLLSQLRVRHLDTCIRMELADSNGIFSAVAAGLGLGLVFSSLTALERPGIAFRPLADVQAESELHLAWRAGNEIHEPILAQFIAITTRWAAERT